MARGKKAEKEPEVKKGRGRPAVPVNMAELEKQLAKLEAAKSPDADEIEKMKRKIRRIKRNKAKAAGTFVPRGARKAKGKAAKKTAGRGRKAVEVVEAEDDDEEED